MKTIGNILWFLFIGWESALCWLGAGLIWCLTIIGIPLGIQCFKLARVSLLPFGTKVELNFAAHPIANVLWLIFGGIGLAFGFALSGLFFCITIIGIPIGMQCFKLARLALLPFGARLS